VPLFIPDTLQETPFYLKAEQLPIQTDSLYMNFGQYESLPTDPQQILFSVDSVFLTNVHSFSGGNVGMELPYSLWINSLFFLLFVACFVVFSLVFRKEGIVFIENFRQTLFIRKHQPTTFKGQVTTTEVWGEFFLVIQTILISAIIFFTFLWDKGIASLSIKGYLLTFIGLLLIPSAMILLKLFMYRTIAVFFMRQQMKRWISHYYRLLELLGILLFLPALLYVFMPELRNIILVLFLFIFIISRLVIALGLLNIFVKNKVGGFYFFAYLCGTEIAPYLLWYKGVLLFISLAGNILI
jgi:hypothetical protein